jgi:hypothetical protein
MANLNISSNYFISSTDRPCENSGATLIRMDKNDMKQVTDLFTKAPCVHGNDCEKTLSQNDEGGKGTVFNDHISKR